MNAEKCDVRRKGFRMFVPSALAPHGTTPMSWYGLKVWLSLIYNVVLTFQFHLPEPASSVNKEIA
jgi:hypothetical protein